MYLYSRLSLSCGHEVCTSAIGQNHFGKGMTTRTIRRFVKNFSIRFLDVLPDGLHVVNVWDPFRGCALKLKSTISSKIINPKCYTIVLNKTKKWEIPRTCNINAMYLHACI